MSNPQVIRWTIYNPASPNIRCSVMHRHDQRCSHVAEWAVIRDLDGSNYRLTAFCAEHWAQEGSDPRKGMDIEPTDQYIGWCPDCQDHRMLSQCHQGQRTQRTGYICKVCGAFVVEQPAGGRGQA